MSIRFDEPVTDKVKDLIIEMFGEPQVHDDFMFLFGRSVVAFHKDLTKLANIANQPVHLVEHGPGDVACVNGEDYRCTLSMGWVLDVPEVWHCDCCHSEMNMDSHQIIIGMKQFCSVACKVVYDLDHQ